MTRTRKLTRIITCQGSIQLIAALAALSCREDEQKDLGYEYEDFLVIYDLYSPRHEQLEEFADFVKKMALSVFNWKSILYVNPDQMTRLAELLEVSPATAFAHLHEFVGASKADEIYLCRSWQFGHRFMMNAYQKAEKICYGDGLGLYFSEAYFSPAATNERRFYSLVRKKLGAVKRFVKRTPRLITVATSYPLLSAVDFDIGYFLLPNILGEEPPMETRLVKKEVTKRIFRELAAALANDAIVEKYKYISSVPTVVLMTSNFSEAKRMSAENEILAYRKFLELMKFPRESTLMIKPHPRDGEQKIQQVGRAVEDLFTNVVLLTEPDLFYIPFELFLMQVFKGRTETAVRDLKIATFSTACLSLQVLFNFEPIIGFGRDLVGEFFHPEFVEGRIKHEYDLHVALQKLAQVV